MAAPTSLGDILENRLGDASYNKLDHLMDSYHQNKIAMSITDWRSIAPFLGLEETDEEDIVTKYSTTKTRNIAMLRKWKHLQGSSATYRKLLEILWDVERVDLIDKLLQMVAVGYPSSQVIQRKTESKDESVVFVKTLSGHCVVLEVISTDTVEDLKIMLQMKLPVEERVETKKMRLIFQGQELSDERLLTEYAIQNHSTVYQRLLTGTIRLGISLPELGLSLPLTVKPATTFTDLVDRVVAMERTLLPYQHLLVALLGRSSVQLSADKYTSSVGDYDLKGKDTVELTVCKGYCHTVRVTVSLYGKHPSNLYWKSHLPRLPLPNGFVLKLHSCDTFRTAEKLILEEKGVRSQIYNSATFYASEVELKQEQVVGTISECVVRIECLLKLMGPFRCAGCSSKSILENSVNPEEVFPIEKKVGVKTVVSFRSSGSAVVYIDKDENEPPMTLYLPDNSVSILIIKELAKEILQKSRFLLHGDCDREVQLLQSGLKLADEIILSECTSTKIEYKGEVILMYHFTSEYSKGYSIRYLNRPVKGSATVCRVQVFSSDTVADLKAAIEEATGIPQQNQALYDGDSLYRIELHDHQVVGDFASSLLIDLDTRILVFVNTLAGIIPFEVLSRDTVLSLKRAIATETEIPVEDQTVLNQNDQSVLEDTKSVGAYVVGDDKLILHCTLVSAVPGAYEHPKAVKKLKRDKGRKGVKEIAKAVQEPKKAETKQ